MSNSLIGVGPLTPIETIGKYGLFRDENNFAWIGINVRKKRHPVLGYYPYNQSKIKSGRWNLVGPEVKGGVRKIVEQNSKNNSLRVTALDEQFKANSSPTIYKVNSPVFDEIEKFFEMKFPRDEESAKINYWAPNLLFSSLWGFKKNASAGGGNAVKAFKQFDTPDQGIKRGSGQNRVAVIDSGIRRTHEDLYQNMWVNKDEIYGNGVDDDGNGYVDDRYGIAFFNLDGIDYYNTTDAYINDSVGHGTHVAGTIAAVANKVGVIGTNPAAKIMNININTPGTRSPSLAGVICGVIYAGDNGSKVINMSLGLGFSETLYDAMKKVSDKYKPLFIVSAGNNDSNNDNAGNYPATFNLDSIISVASSNDQGNKAGTSNYGKETVDLYAPGERILSTTRESNYSYGYKSGTSMAAPFVAGAVSAYWARNKGLTNIQVKNHLLNTATKKDAYADTVTGGIINMNKMFATQSSSLDQVDLKDNTGNDHSKKDIKRWEKLYEIEASELSGFKSSKITTTLFGHLSDEWQKAYKRNFIERESLNDSGIFKHIENVETFGDLDPGFIIFNIDKSHGLGKKKILKKFFDKGVFTSVEVDRKLPKFDSALQPNERVELITFENGVRPNNVLKGGIDDDVLTGGVSNDRLYVDKGDDLLIGGAGGAGKDRVWDQGGRDTFRIQRGSGYTIIEDFSDGVDRIQLGSGTSGVQLKTRGEDHESMYLDQRGDLMAVVEDATGDVQRSGNLLV